MKERERIVVTGLVVLLMILWLGFLAHRSPRFAGSAWGGALGVSGALLMLLPLAYTAVKRIKALKRGLSKSVSMRTLLSLHIYAGVLGPVLVLLHTGHKFESVLGITLTGLTILVALSGFVGRYLMKQFGKEIREKKATLDGLQNSYATLRAELGRRGGFSESLRPFSGVLPGFLAAMFIKEEPSGAVLPGAAGASVTAAPATLLRLSESIADVEYAIKTHETFKEWFSKWLKFHIVISFILYGLMALHVWASIHFGLRWFDSWTPSTLASASSDAPSLRSTAPAAFLRVDPSFRKLLAAGGACARCEIVKS